MICSQVVRRSWFVAHSGVSRWHALYGKLKMMHSRMLESVGEEQFHAAVTRRYPLVLDDESVVALATTLGWQSTWVRANAKAKAAPPPANRDLAQMLSATTAAGPSPGALPGLTSNAGTSMPAAPPAPRPPASPATRLNLFVRNI